MFRFGADDILRVINEKVNLSSLNERRYDLARLRLTFLGFVQSIHDYDLTCILTSLPGHSDLLCQNAGNSFSAFDNPFTIAKHTEISKPI